jgi:SAM-dependent methyltransferase
LVNDNSSDLYYERAWAQIAGSLSHEEEERIKQTLSLIPEDCTSLLDVACGDGRMTNYLIPCLGKVVGLERSREALRHVKADRVLGTLESLPFADGSFDLVLCCEVLEHLSFEVYPRAIEEMQRIASKHVIVTVPNRENLKKSLVTCPSCGCRFNPWRHLRSFNPQALSRLFTRFRLQVLRSSQPVEIYPSLLLKGAKLAGLVPRQAFPSKAVCPQCSYRQATTQASLAINGGRGSGLLVRLARGLAKWLVPRSKRSTWLLALYQRT